VRLARWISFFAEKFGMRLTDFRSGKSLTRDQILETHARYEAHQEAKTPTMPYSELLGVVHSKVAREWQVETTADEDIKFGSSVPDWPASPIPPPGCSI
jgi:2-haloacid dehalogenase